MTAHFQSDEFVPIDQTGLSLPVTASQQIPSGTHGLIFAGVNSSGQTVFASFSGDALKVTSTERTAAEVDLAFESLTGSHYAMMIDLSNVSSSYAHSPSLSGIKLSSIQGYCEKTHAQEKWKLHLGVVRSTSITGSLINWISVGHQSLSDTYRFHNSVDSSPVNSVDLTVVAGSLTNVASNNSQLVSDVKSDTLMIDAMGKQVTPESGDLLLRITKASEFSGSLSCHYHLWYLID